MIDQHIVQSYNKELNELKNLIIQMMGRNLEQLNLVYEALAKHDIAAAKDIINYDEKINKMDSQIISMCINILSLRNPLAYDLRFVFAASHISRNLERIGDNIRNIAKNINNLDEGNVKLEDIMLRMIHTLLEMLHNTENAYISKKYELAKKTIIKDIDIDELYNSISDLAITKIKNIGEQINIFQSYILMARYLERIGDHIVNICKQIIFIEKGILNH